jgi:hypothetical protein
MFEVFSLGQVRRPPEYTTQGALTTDRSGASLVCSSDLIEREEFNTALERARASTGELKRLPRSYLNQAHPSSRLQLRLHCERRFREN